MKIKIEAPRVVEVVRCGSEGFIPIHPTSCPYKGEVSCVSSGGGSMCNFLGHPKIVTDFGAEIKSQLFVVCGEPLELEAPVVCLSNPVPSEVEVPDDYDPSYEEQQDLKAHVQELEEPDDEGHDCFDPRTGMRYFTCQSCGMICDQDDIHSGGECNLCHAVNKDD